ncbi:hypothetical protein DSO57_1004578 [Entomophthora muscae]|uniref:Uncharacterized protein n=1 Tax=Entomophthora muscae TaxID=34485 RepID=A0ACC2RZ49_9FUNG|nr:hypothetical protein DSO57_1004578 [Entomophthora muscae]
MSFLTSAAANTRLYINLSPGLHLEAVNINSVLHQKPLSSPGIHDSAAHKVLKVLLFNLLGAEMKVSKGQPIATLRVGHDEDLKAVHFLGGLEELEITLPEKPPGGGKNPLR